MKHPKVFWRGVPFILTSNKLPTVFREPKKKNDEDVWDWNARFDNFKALVTRCRIHQMTNSKRNYDKFPYTSEDLAVYMNYVCDQMRPGNQGEVFPPSESQGI